MCNDFIAQRLLLFVLINASAHDFILLLINNVFYLSYTGRPSPSVAPTTRSPSGAPSTLFYTECEMFTASNTNSALINYQTCFFYACPGTSATINTCDNSASRSYSCVGDTYLRLFDATGSFLTSNDDMGGVCGACSSLSYTFGQPCQYYSLREGCFGSSSCSGTVHISSNVAITIGIAYHSNSVPSSLNSYTALKQSHLLVLQSVRCQLASLLTIGPAFLPAVR